MHEVFCRRPRKRPESSPSNCCRSSRSATPCQIVAVVVDEFGSTVGIVTAEDLPSSGASQARELEARIRHRRPHRQLQLSAGVSGFPRRRSTTLRDLGTQPPLEAFPARLASKLPRRLPPSPARPPPRTRREHRVQRPPLHRRRDGQPPHSPSPRRNHRPARRRPLP